MLLNQSHECRHLYFGHKSQWSSRRAFSAFHESHLACGNPDPGFFVFVGLVICLYIYPSIVGGREIDLFHLYLIYSHLLVGLQVYHTGGSRLDGDAVDPGQHLVNISHNGSLHQDFWCDLVLDHHDGPYLARHVG